MAAAALHAAQHACLARSPSLRLLPPLRKSFTLPLIRRRASALKKSSGRKVDHAGRIFQADSVYRCAVRIRQAGLGSEHRSGRVYLALGPPTKITHIPSSRIFFPLEIWYYDVVPGVLSTELRLIFFRKNNVGFLHLYSPTTDTLRALLIPQAAVQDTFGPNDDYDRGRHRGMITVPPGEDEVISACVNVATGIQHMGNDEILGKISSPSLMLGKTLTANVNSRIIFNHPKLDILESASPFGGSQIDLGIEVTVQNELELQVPKAL